MNYRHSEFEIEIRSECYKSSEKMSGQKVSKNWSFETKAINIGQEYTQWQNNEMVPPIVTSATYHLNDPTKITVKTPHSI